MSRKPSSRTFASQSLHYAAVHSHVLQDVLARLDKAYQAFFRRVKRGEKAGYPRFKGRNRFHSFTCKEYGNGARLDSGGLVLAKIERISVHWSRPTQGIPKTVTISHEADGWYAAILCAAAPVQPLPPTGQETAIDLGIEALAPSPMGRASSRRAATVGLRGMSPNASAASRSGRRAATDGAKRLLRLPKPTRGRGASGGISITRRRSN